MSYVTKGTRVTVERLIAASHPVSLAGVQLKFEASFQSFTGTVRHIRGNDPTNPTVVKFWVEPDLDNPSAVLCAKCGVLEVGPLAEACINPIESEV